jgi:hypothetical protein
MYSSTTSWLAAGLSFLLPSVFTYKLSLLGDRKRRMIITAALIEVKMNSRYYSYVNTIHKPYTVAFSTPNMSEGLYKTSLV